MGHHLVLGELEDFITGRTVADTHDERLRQRVARLLVDERGFDREDIAVRRWHTVRVDGREQRCLADFVVSLDGRAAMLIRYAPGSLVSRERPTLALARLLEPHVVPLGVITNGRDARVLDGPTGELLGRGLAAIPSKEALRAQVASRESPSCAPQQRPAEARILLAFDGLERGCEAEGE